MSSLPDICGACGSAISMWGDCRACIQAASPEPQDLLSDAILIPTATVQEAEDLGGFRVVVSWPGVDRPRTGGFVLGNPITARRLAAAINAGAVYSDPEIRMDVDGKTYVRASSRVLGRTASADLKRLGF